MSECPLCGTKDSIEFDPAALAQVCISCGYIGQAELEHVDVWEDGRTTGMTWVGDPNWTAKKAEDERICREALERLRAPGALGRAMQLWEQSSPKFINSPRKKLLMAACACIALTENKKSSAMDEIAANFQVEEHTLRKFLSSFKLMIKYSPPNPADLMDPSHYLPRITSLLTQLASPTPPANPSIPASARTHLRNVSLRAVQDLAGGIASLAVSSKLTLNRRNTEPLACAVMLMALDAQPGGQMRVADRNALMKVLAIELSANLAAVEERVTDVLKMLKDLRRELPWFNDSVEGAARGKKVAKAKEAPGRQARKISESLVWVKEVVDFGAQVIKRREQQRVSSASATTALLPASASDSSSNASSSASPAPFASASTDSPSSTSNPSLKRKSTHDPYHGRPSYTGRTNYDTHPAKDAALASSAISLLTSTLSTLPTEPDTSGSGPSLAAIDSLKQAILDSAARPRPSRPKKPSRLTVLLQERRVSADDLGDEDLFEEGELEGLVRDEAEVAPLRAEWEAPGGRFDIPPPQPKKARTSAARGADGQKAKRTKARNKEDFERILSGLDTIENDREGDGDLDEDDRRSLSPYHSPPPPSPASASASSYPVFPLPDNLLSSLAASSKRQRLDDPTTGLSAASSFLSSAMRLEVEGGPDEDELEVIGTLSDGE